MSELIYREVVAVGGFDPEQDVTASCSLTGAKRRLQLPEASSVDPAEENRLHEAFVADEPSRSRRVEE